MSMKKAVGLLKGTNADEVRATIYPDVSMGGWTGEFILVKNGVQVAGGGESFGNKTAGIFWLQSLGRRLGFENVQVKELDHAR
ncbi:MAG: hypothetical protein IMZ69_00920 [Spirochaetes bacterium]|nr:hypothetical protein [Spirochaetota bacterium]